MSLFKQNRPSGSDHSPSADGTMCGQERVKKSQILPVLLPPSSLRPVVFRTFTKRHNLTVTTTSLQLLASFIGKNCGSGWREEGLAEPVLDEIAKTWKKTGGGVIVEDGPNVSLSSILRDIQTDMSGGRLLCRDVGDRGPLTLDASNTLGGNGVTNSNRSDGEAKSFPVLTKGARLDNVFPLPNDDEAYTDSRRWIKVVGAFGQPRLTYNLQSKQFEQSLASSSLFPSPSNRGAVLRDRYHVIHQRLLRNEAFQTSTSASFRRSSTRQQFKLTSIANLQGRSGTSHLLLGLLAVSPTGDLSLIDPTGTTTLDLRHAKTVPEGGAWFAPGMIVLVDGVYEEEDTVSGAGLLGAGGIGGTIGGKFLGFSVAGPPCERRELSLGSAGLDNEDPLTGRSFGWTDFLGVGSERVLGPRMRLVEKQYVERRELDGPCALRSQIVVMSEVNLDISRTREAFRTVLDSYVSLPEEILPVVFLVIGNFVSRAVVGGQGSGGSIEYKENFDSFASVLSDYSRLLRNSTFVFVPGDNDLWASSFSSGATTSIPKRPIPEMFTSRVRRAFHSANNESQSTGTGLGGEAIWSTNPTRLSIFGPVQELVVFRDDISGRLRRTSLNFKKKESLDSLQTTANYDGDDAAMPDCDDGGTNFPSPEGSDSGRQRATKPHALAARKLIKTILDQGCLSPFPSTLRPILWDYVSSLQLYPLPTALVLADPEAEPFTVTYEGCHVMNPGRLVPENCVGTIRWIEYDFLAAKGRIIEKQDNKS